MSDHLDPTKFGLPPRTVLKQIGQDAIAIIINRKSRIIMADGRKIVEKAEKIREVMPKAQIAFRTTAPICSKTKIYLEEQSIQVL